ncbi:unnamed protein product, partial [marine sediment metagenome]
MSKLDLSISVWKPWHLAAWPNRISIEEQIKMVTLLGARAVAIKGTNREKVFGAKENLLYPGCNHSNDHIEKEAKAKGHEVDLWCWVDCRFPAAQAAVVKEANARWNPRNIDIDHEGGIAKAYSHQNTGAFLRSLGRLHRHDGTPVKVWLQSYRRPDLHSEIAWHKWLSYTGSDGQYLLEGINPQAYYVGTQDSIADYRKMLLAYEKIEAEINRTLTWRVTLPTYR